MTTSSIVIIGAGPGIGMAVARRFGREGYNVGLVSRSVDRLAQEVAALGELGVEAVAYPGDVLDRPQLRHALQNCRKALGTIDVIEYSPTPSAESLAMPRQITVDNATYHFEFGVLGAIAAVAEVLPEMLERGHGGLLFTTAHSAVRPVPFSANFAIAAAGLRSYVHGLHDDLQNSGVYAGIIEVAGGIGEPDSAAGAGSSLPLIPASEVGDLFWELFTERDRFEAVVGDPAALHRLLGLPDS